MVPPHDTAALLPYIVAALVLAFTVIMGGLFAAGLTPSIPGLPGLPSLPRAGASPVSNGGARGGSHPPPIDPGDKYPGMVNLSGTLCYMNSVLQAFASLPTQLAHLERIVSLAINADVPTPVTDALLDLLTELNTGHARTPPALRPHALIAALSALPQVRRLLATREQQDAHELFVVLAEAVSDEATKVAKEIARTRGLGQALDFSPPTREPSPSPPASISSSSWTSSRAPSVAPTVRAPFRRPESGLAQPWEGLLARRRVCRRCGYSDVIRTDTLGGMELPIPRSVSWSVHEHTHLNADNNIKGDATLDECISEYLAPEALEGVTCDMCTLRATAEKYAAKAATQPVSEAESAAGKKKRATVIRTAKRLAAMVDAGVPALDTPNVKWETVRTDTIRETAVTRAPRTLRFLFVRSEYTPYGQLLKKTARIAYPLMFDMGPHMARGVWEPRPESLNVAGMIKAGAGAGPAPRALYRLQSVILHYGYTHSSGHYVAIRRKPNAPLGVPGKGWLRISDADVDEVGADELAATRGQVFMLFYERVDLPKNVEAMINAPTENNHVDSTVGGARYLGEVDSMPGTPAEPASTAPSAALDLPTENGIDSLS